MTVLQDLYWHFTNKNKKRITDTIVSHHRKCSTICLWECGWKQMINKAALRCSQLMKLVSKRAGTALSRTSLSDYNNCNPAEFGAGGARRELARAAAWAQ